MGSEVETLEARARELAEVAVGRVEAERAARLVERLVGGRFLVSVVGEFKRGKSTLINALVGDEVLPTGVLPLTAVATEVAYGESRVVVDYLDGVRTEVGLGELAEFVTEQGNPANQRGIARVEVRGRWPLLKPGVVLVDTPGIGSVYRHNTETARQAVLDADGAVLVLAADIAMSERERDLVGRLAQRRAPTFFVLNKADHLTPGELDQVRRFVEQVLCDDLGRKARVFALSARAALAARMADQPSGPEAGEFVAFMAELERFVAEDLVTARLATARTELARLGATLRDGLAVEQAALDLDEASLTERVDRFRGEADRQRRGFDDARTLLNRDVTRIGTALGERLAAFARTGPGQHLERLADLASTAPRSRLAEELRAAIEGAVGTAFESFRQAEADRTEQAWQQLAAGFRADTQQRVDAVRDAAADLFAIPLPQATVPAIAEERKRFFYLFLHVGGFNQPFGPLLGRLVPTRTAGRVLLAWARAELTREFDKHAGRARWDLTQRLDAVRRRFETAMGRQLEETIEAILAVTARAEQLRQVAGADRAAQAARGQRQAAVAAALVQLTQVGP